MADKESLIAAIERHESLAETNGNITQDRTDALDYYLGNPRGDEITGRSQVISRDVFDTVEWIKPQLADIFCAGEEVIKFQPRNAEDVPAAEQESEFVNYIITQKNSWFNVWYAWSHDALLQKVGYVKAYWDDSNDRTKEKYEKLTADELTELVENLDGAEILEEAQNPDGTFSVTVGNSGGYHCVRLVNIPPENVKVDISAPGLDLQDPRVGFVEHKEQKTLTQLRDEGFDVPDDLSDAGASENWTSENALRNLDNPPIDDGESEPSSRKVWVREVWIRYDDDGDGLAELRHVIVVGTTILQNEEADSVDIYALCPAPLPHQHNGLSLADAVSDLQDIKTALWRGSLDNLYLANNGRHAIDQNTVNLDDMLVSRPGGVVRVDGNPQMSIVPLQHASTGAVSVPMLEYADRIKQQRTGINEQSQGLDSNTINKNTPYATTSALMSAAQQRIKFIARIFAETGVKQLFGGVHAKTMKHSRQAEMIQLRNQWVPVDPRQWKKRTDMQIAVGLGAGDKAQQIIFLEGVLQKQVLGLQAGLCTPAQVFNTLKRYMQAGGYKNITEFFTDPATLDPNAPKPPPPEVQAEMAKAAAQKEIEAMKGQITLQLEQAKGQIELQKLQGNLQLQATNDERDAQREILRAEMEHALEQRKQQVEQWKATLEADMAKYKTDQDNAVKLQIAQIGAQTTLKSAHLSSQTTLASGDMKVRADLEKQRVDHEFEGAEQEPEPEKPDPHAEMMGKLTEALSAINETQKKLAQGQDMMAKAISRPRTLVRGPDGKAIGVQ